MTGAWVLGPAAHLLEGRRVRRVVALQTGQAVRAQEVARLLRPAAGQGRQAERTVRSSRIIRASWVNNDMPCTSAGDMPSSVGQRATFGHHPTRPLLRSKRTGTAGYHQGRKQGASLGYGASAPHGQVRLAAEANGAQHRQRLRVRLRRRVLVRVRAGRLAVGLQRTRSRSGHWIDAGAVKPGASHF